MQNLAVGLNGLLSKFVQGMTEEAGSEISVDSSDDDNEGSNEDDCDNENGSESEEDDQVACAPHITKDDAPSRRAGKEVVSSGNQSPFKGQAQASSSASIPPPHSQIFLPSDSDLDPSDDNRDHRGYVPDSPIECTQRADEVIRVSASGLAARLTCLKQQQIKAAPDLNKMELLVLAEAADLDKDTSKNDEKQDI
jgi:hypothetical protein